MKRKMDFGDFNVWVSYVMMFALGLGGLAIPALIIFGGALTTGERADMGIAMGDRAYRRSIVEVTIAPPESEASPSPAATSEPDATRPSARPTRTGRSPRPSASATPANR
jgi:hypothetical protein